MENFLRNCRTFFPENELRGLLDAI